MASLPLIKEHPNESHFVTSDPHLGGAIRRYAYQSPFALWVDDRGRKHFIFHKNRALLEAVQEFGALQIRYRQQVEAVLELMELKGEITVHERKRW